jgi:flagellar basal-body rod protein FlgB
MSKIVGNMLNYYDRAQVASLGQRVVRNNVITANIANAETPGFRSLSYGFEEQLGELLDSATNEENARVKVTNSKHLISAFANAAGEMQPDVYVTPTETIPEDGNTVDVDKEMAALSQNQILYRTAVELINRKLATIRYAITGGGR